MDDPDALYNAEMVRRHGQLSDAYDRAVLTLSAGALALSVTFAGRLVKRPLDDSWALGVGWGLLVVSVLAITFSYIPSLTGHTRVLQGRDDDAAEVGKWADRLSIGGGVALALGLALLAFFAFKNL